jgi:hypothetical protein
VVQLAVRHLLTTWAWYSLQHQGRAERTCASWARFAERTRLGTPRSPKAQEPGHLGQDSICPPVIGNGWLYVGNLGGAVYGFGKRS